MTNPPHMVEGEKAVPTEKQTRRLSGLRWVHGLPGSEAGSNR